MFRVEIDDFLDAFDQTRESMRDIVFACGKVNKSLDDILINYSWDQIPVLQLNNILEMYNMSKINILTGEIIEPCEKLITYKFFKIIETSVYLDGLMNDDYREKFNDLLIYFELQLLDKDDNEIKRVTADNYEKGIDLSKTLILRRHIAQRLTVIHDEIDFKIDKIVVNVVIKKNPKIEEDNIFSNLGITIFRNNDTYKEKDIKCKVQNEISFEVLKIFRNINDWVIF